jgi:hypothetical protein
MPDAQQTSIRRRDLLALIGTAYAPQSYAINRL